MGVIVADAPPLDTNGLKVALAEAAAADDAAFAAEQADLFAGSALATVVAKRPAHRPPGAQNHSTKAWRDWFLRQYRSPILALADLYSADPIQLLEAIRAKDATLERSVSLHAVLQLQRDAAVAVLPYVHRKQPLAIDGGEDKPLPSINFVTVAGAQLVAAEAGGFVVEGPVVAEVAPESRTLPGQHG